MQISPEFVRRHASGFVGGSKIAQKATDEEIKLLCELQNKAALLYNQEQAVLKMIDNLKKAIEGR